MDQTTANKEKRKRERQENEEKRAKKHQEDFERNQSVADISFGSENEMDVDTQSDKEFEIPQNPNTGRNG